MSKYRFISTYQLEEPIPGASFPTGREELRGSSVRLVHGSWPYEDTLQIRENDKVIGDCRSVPIIPQEDVKWPQNQV
jgi:hypothetical protein